MIRRSTQVLAGTATSIELSRQAQAQSDQAIRRSLVLLRQPIYPAAVSPLRVRRDKAEP